MKHTLLISLLLGFFLTALADEGMWVLTTVQSKMLPLCSI